LDKNNYKINVIKEIYHNSMKYVSVKCFAITVHTKWSEFLASCIASKTRETTRRWGEINNG